MKRLILKCIIFMERTGVLIERLLQQYHDNADADKMLVTVQLLAAELQQKVPAGANAGKKVSVVMPRYIRQAVLTEEVLDRPKPEPKPAQVTQPVVQQTAAIPAPQPYVLQPPLQPEVYAPKPPVEEPKKFVQPPLPQLPKVKAWQYDPVADIPTLTHQHKDKAELNEIMAAKGESFNDRLKATNVELGAMLQSSPLKDLKKAIGINDRYVFMNDLFRGDEAMYERSIKTINNFSNYGEAELWIKRELKLKLAWNEDTDAVRNFDQLVKRRFS